jgi:hypothetical protein
MARNQTSDQGQEPGMSEPTKKPHRPWSRISIRMSMLIVFAIAVVLGWQVNKAREQRRAVAAVEQYGGWAHYDYEFVNGKLTPGRNPWAPRWLRKILGDEFFQTVRLVNLVYDDSAGKRLDNSNTTACDDLLRQLSRLDGLKELLLTETQTTDAGLAHIGKMTELEALFIWDARSVTDAGIARLTGLKKLKTIHISQSHLTDSSLALLSSLPSVESLSLQQNHFSDKGLERLARKPRIKSLWIGLGDIQVTDAGLAHLRSCESLEELDLQGSRVTAHGLSVLKDLPNLRALYLGGPSITGAQVQSVREAMPNVRVSP